MDTPYNLACLYRDTGILYVDNTILSTLAQCETQAMLRYGYFVAPENDSSAPMLAGIAVHKALEIHYLGGTLDEATSALFDSYYDYATANIAEGDRLCYSNVVEIVRSWIWHHPLDKLPYTVDPDYVEMAFSQNLTDDIVFVGRIDACATRTDGAGFYLIDTKSTGRIDIRFKSQFNLSTQLSGYIWALEKYLCYPVTGAYINVVDMRLVPNNAKRKCTSHKCFYADCGYLHMSHQLLGPFYRSPAAIKTWKRNAIRLARQWQTLLDRNLSSLDMIARVPQSGMFKYQTCSLCAYQDFCRQDRNLYLLYDIPEPWWPGDTKAIGQNVEGMKQKHQKLLRPSGLILSSRLIISRLKSKICQLLPNIKGWLTQLEG